MNTALAFICGALVLGGCASSQVVPAPTVAAPASQTEAQPKSAMGHEMAATCPMAVAGTTARAEDVEGGAALAFTTTGDVAELRRRVAHMVEMHEKHHGEGHGSRMGGGGVHEGQEGEGKGRMGEGGGMMPPATARSEDIEGGARLIFTPRDAADLPKLRAHARQHAEKMASGQCPMMGKHRHGHEGSSP